MPIQLSRTKVYEVKCRSCGISETMVFNKVGLTLRYMPMIEDENSALSPELGISGDKPPVTCPKCCKKLNIKEIMFRH